MKLSGVKVNQKVKLISVDCEKSIKERLQNLGLTNGVSIVVKRVAPFLDPIEIEFRGFCLAIRKSVADKIIVKYE